MSTTYPLPEGQTPGRFTWEDFVALEEDDPRELIDGHLVEAEVPGETHEHIVARLLAYLVAWTDAQRGGRVLASGYKVKISPRRGVMPDVQLYRRGNVAKRTENALESGRPDLVIEVLSPSRRGFDRVTKLGYYASLAIPEYWIIDPEEQTLERLVFREGHYAIEESLQGGAVFRPATFAMLEIPLARLWEKWDEAVGPG